VGAKKECLMVREDKGFCVYRDYEINPRAIFKERSDAELFLALANREYYAISAETYDLTKEVEAE